MVIKLYWHPLSPPTKVVWSVLEALQISYEKIYIDLLETHQHRSPEYLAVNPEGKVPFIIDGDFKLAESRAIICYLCAKYEDKEKENKLYPTDPQERAQVDQVLYQDFQYFVNALEYFNMIGIISRGETGPVESRLPGVMDALHSLERRFKKHKYMAGEHITLADYSAMSLLSGLDVISAQEAQTKFPRLIKWTEKMQSLPMYKVCYSEMMTKEIYKQLIERNMRKNA